MDRLGMLEMSSPGGSLLGLLLAIREAILRFRFVDEPSLGPFLLPRPRQRRRCVAFLGKPTFA